MITEEKDNCNLLYRETNLHNEGIHLNMVNALVNFKKICSLPLVRLVSLEASLENAPKKSFFRRTLAV